MFGAVGSEQPQILVTKVNLSQKASPLERRLAISISGGGSASFG
jgi:hypothetical protein